MGARALAKDRRLSGSPALLLVTESPSAGFTSRLTVTSQNDSVPTSSWQRTLPLTLSLKFPCWVELHTEIHDQASPQQAGHPGGSPEPYRRVKQKFTFWKSEDEQNDPWEILLKCTDMRPYYARKWAVSVFSLPLELCLECWRLHTWPLRPLSDLHESKSVSCKTQYSLK